MWTSHIFSVIIVLFSNLIGKIWHDDFDTICVSYDIDEDKHLFTCLLTICFSFVTCLLLVFVLGLTFFFLVIFKIALMIKVSAFVCFLTLVNVHVVTSTMFYHWKLCLWSYAEIIKITCFNNKRTSRTFTEYINIRQVLF